MSRNLKFFFIAFSASIFIWAGMNILTDNLEDFLFSEVYRLSSQPLLAQINLQVSRNLDKETPEIEAKSVISVKIDKQGNEKIIFEKNSDEILPIASLTKLMTAFVALEYYDSSEMARISKEAVAQPEDFGQLKVGERLSVENLLYITLIESSNDSAYALSELMSKEAFVDLMNIEAEYLGLKNTYFTDPAGYDSENHSTVQDLVKFARYLLDKRPEIWEITVNPEFELYDLDGVFHHQLLTTNEIINEFPEIIGGKTGYTLEAKGCLILVLKDKRTENIFINVILRSDNRFEDMKKLINYVR
ncbi:MAG TPA: D-alanyl-D-alanine carboxypeptidase [Candidatus Nealsonbacteria bacterium]|uniref:Peptidase S11 D-alanyl-D-alanine carboxypeptidase A N-terminal domain-containing protein n=1 Tax=marine sediment metagenome TaxID=412755 RepID=A0A0F9XT71_9ZZZZ|nr:D-alanyl-D-alanine carboxypeptidase [Candidatus Nealsonbacteria bacterium]HEB46715.1 D-alanyl-D-alanine carboxypeptidase [Candidatus Nealsonbacteria bacterium]